MSTPNTTAMATTTITTTFIFCLFFTSFFNEFAIEKKKYFSNSIKQTGKNILALMVHQNTIKRAMKTIGPYLALKQAFEYIHPEHKHPAC